MQRKTAKMYELEHAYHQPIAQLLRDLYAETGTIADVARRLGTSVSTVSNWLARFDIPTRATITPGEFLLWEQSNSSSNRNEQTG